MMSYCKNNFNDVLFPKHWQVLAFGISFSLTGANTLESMGLLSSWCARDQCRSIWINMDQLDLYIFLLFRYWSYWSIIDLIHSSNQYRSFRLIGSMINSGSIWINQTFTFSYWSLLTAIDPYWSYWSVLIGHLICIDQLILIDPIGVIDPIDLPSPENRRAEWKEP